MLTHLSEVRLGDNGDKQLCLWINTIIIDECEYLTWLSGHELCPRQCFDLKEKVFTILDDFERWSGCSIDKNHRGSNFDRHDVAIKAVAKILYKYDVDDIRAATFQG